MSNRPTGWQPVGGGTTGKSYAKYSPLTYPLSLVMAAIAYLQEELDTRRASGQSSRDLVQVVPLIYAGYRWLADLADQEGGCR